MEQETWKYVVGYEGRFAISNWGRLMSLEGKFKGANILNPTIDKLGYLSTTLRNGKNKKRSVRIHTLVAETFLSKPNIKNPCVNHLDGNKLNNRVENLEWTDLKTNCLYSINKGWVDKKGVNHFNAKLTDEMVIKIRHLYSQGDISQNGISKIFGIGRRHVGDIINRVCWKHI